MPLNTPLQISRDAGWQGESWALLRKFLGNFAQGPTPLNHFPSIPRAPRLGTSVARQKSNSSCGNESTLLNHSRDDESRARRDAADERGLQRAAQRLHSGKAAFDETEN